MWHNKSMGMAALCAAVALLAGVAGAIGVFARGDGSYSTITSVRGVEYQMVTSGVYAYNSQQVVAEGLGWDAFTLVAAVPLMLLAALLVARGSFRGRLLAIGLLGYFFYQYLEYSVTWAFGPLFLLFVVTYALSLAGIVWLGASVSREGIADRFEPGFPARPFALITVALSSMLTMLWLQRIGAGLAGDLQAARLTGETTMVVQALDLGLVVPTSLFVAVMAWRGTPAGRLLAAVYVVTATAMASAILTMLVAAAFVAGALELEPIVIFGAYVLLAGAFGLRMYRSAGGRAQPKRHSTREAVRPLARA